MEFKGFDENFSLSGKTALVTGAGAGIGQAIALMFARKGADIAAADIDKEAAEATAKRIEGQGRKGVALIGDITDPKVVESVVSGAVAHLGKLDIIAASAFGYYMSWERIPHAISRFLIGVTDNPIIMLPIINLFLLVLGMFLEGTPTLISRPGKIIFLAKNLEKSRKNSLKFDENRCNYCKVPG
ncbi:MAG: SDR family NAD(P)-dependent oxidoreductase [Planctomycetota bacterium]|nr:SDR family NAD(P)-dependent oxidoreductase [Planctomycetota bacterium]